MWKKQVEVQLEIGGGNTTGNGGGAGHVVHSKSSKVSTINNGIIHGSNDDRPGEAKLEEATELINSKLILNGSSVHSVDQDSTNFELIDLDNEMENEQEQEFNKLKLTLTTTTPTTQQISPLTQQHALWPEMDRITLEQLHYAKLGVGEGGWTIFAKEGEMKMYKREEEIDGLIIDPLKAVHTVKGVTAHEMCHYFFSPDVRTEWETTLDQMTILEKISDDAMIFWQIHKRIWPATQRDALFWSHIRTISPSEASSTDKNAQNSWIVCNHSSKHSKAPTASGGGGGGDGKKSNNNGKYIRIFLTVSLMCETVIDDKPNKKNDEPITRDDLTCHITYSSVVNPGGWVPAAGVRAVYKREYPRFLKKFTQYVLDKCKNQPIMF